MITEDAFSFPETPLQSVELTRLPGGTRVFGQFRESVEVALFPDRIEIAPVGLSRLFRLTTAARVLSFDQLTRVVCLRNGGLALDLGSGPWGRRVHTLDGEAAIVLGALARAGQGAGGPNVVALPAVHTVDDTPHATGVLLVGPGGLEFVPLDGLDRTPIRVPMTRIEAFVAESAARYRFEGGFSGALVVETHHGGGERLAAWATAFGKARAASSSPARITAAQRKTTTARGGKEDCEREFHRVALAEPVFAHARRTLGAGRWQECELVNLSAGGFRARVVGPIEQGAKWTFELPTELGVPGLQAEVVYRHALPGISGMSMVGFHLVRATPHQRARLQREVLRQGRVHRAAEERLKRMRTHDEERLPELAVA